MDIYILELFGVNQERKKDLVEYVQKNSSNVIHALNTMLLTNFIFTVNFKLSISRDLDF